MLISASRGASRVSPEFAPIRPGASVRQTRVRLANLLCDARSGLSKPLLQAGQCVSCVFTSIETQDALALKSVQKGERSAQK
jgi:hypothetical protein